MHIRRVIVTGILLACYCVCAFTVSHFVEGSFRSGHPNTHLVIVVLTGKSWGTIGVQGWRTWHRHVTGSTRLVLASDRPIPEVPSNLVHIQAGKDSHDSASRRFIEAILEVEMLQDEYMFLVDDDAFVVTHNVETFVRELEKVKYRSSVHGSRDDGHVYGEFRCASLCGGGGVLLDPEALRMLRASGNLLLDLFDINPSRNRCYDVVLSKAIENLFPNITMMDCAGFFNSQPPNHYQFQPSDSTSSLLRKALPVTFHYVDEFHQSAFNVSFGYKCDPCVSLIPELYRQFYGDQTQIPTSESSVDIAYCSLSISS